MSQSEGGNFLIIFIGVPGTEKSARNLHDLLREPEKSGREGERERGREGEREEGGRKR